MMGGIDMMPHHRKLYKLPVLVFLAYVSSDMAANYSEAARINPKKWEGIGTEKLRPPKKQYTKAEKQEIADEYMAKMKEEIKNL